MAGRLQGKRVVVTDASEFMGPDIVALFREEGGEVIADVRDPAASGNSKLWRQPSFAMPRAS